MTKRKKLTKRFLSTPRDFTWEQLDRMLRGFGYQKQRAGRTSGSRVAFMNPDTKHVIRLHRPHGKAVKRYQLRLVPARDAGQAGRNR